MYKKIEHYIAKHNLFPQGTKVVIGLSGGPDSVFLFHFLTQLHKTNSISLIAAHLDHQWRPSSVHDEQFCRTLAHEYDIPFVSARLNDLTIPIKKNGSQEEYARKARRFFLEQVLHDHCADYIALAHHAQDQQETFFLRLIRGSSLTGLTVMKPKIGYYVRPLLEIKKTDILAWLTHNNYTYCIDETNESPKYLRNRIRKTIETLRESDTRFDHSFSATLQRLQNTEQFLEKYTNELFFNITEQSNDKIILNCKKFTALDPIIRHRILLKLFIVQQIPFYPTETFFNEVIRFLQTDRGGTHAIHEHWTIVKKQGKAYINHLI